MATPNGPQFQEVLDIINRSKGSIEGEDARKIFRAANIRSWPMEEMPVMSRGYSGLDQIGSVSKHETLHTAQSHLHGPTLRRYMNEGPPEQYPEYEEPRKYLPEVLESKRGHRWIDEGHHRLVADRLNDFYESEVYEGRLG